MKGSLAFLKMRLWIQKDFRAYATYSGSTEDYDSLVRKNIGFHK